MSTNYFLKAPQSCKAEDQIVAWLQKQVDEMPAPYMNSVGDFGLVVNIGDQITIKTERNQAVFAKSNGQIVLLAGDDNRLMKAQLIAIIDGIKEGRARKEPCACINHREGLHIGKSSAGWCFSLRVYDWHDPLLDSYLPADATPLIDNADSLAISDLDDWIPLIEKYGCIDEYDKEVSAEEMLNCIRDRRWDRNARGSRLSEAINAGGGSIDEATNLIRHKIDGHCIGHGPGPWDYCKGEFS